MRDGKNKRIWLGVVILFIAVYAVTFFRQAGPAPTVIVCGSMVGGMVLWLKTTFNVSISPHKLIPAYLLTLALFFMHITEECLTDFPGSINGLFGTEWGYSEFILLIALIGPIIWVLGAIALFYKHPIGYYLAWFIFFGMLIGEPVHYLVFPVIQGIKTGLGYGYFSAMWTALFPMVPGIYGVYTTIIEYRKEKSRMQID